MPAGEDDDDDNHGHATSGTQLATGQYITPTFIDGAVQQFLNPGLAGYPNFVAGEAVRSQLSPDGTTLAIITAGQNSLYKPDGHGRHGQLDAVHLPLQRGGRQQGQARAHAR